jgi:hypothetical protein
MLKATPSNGAPLGLVLAWQLATMPAPAIFWQMSIAESGEVERPVLAPEVSSCAALGSAGSGLLPLRE